MRALREETSEAEAQLPLASELPLRDAGWKWLPQPPPPPGDPPVSVTGLFKAEQNLQRVLHLHNQNFMRKKAAEKQAEDLRAQHAAVIAKGKRGSQAEKDAIVNNLVLVDFQLQHLSQQLADGVAQIY